MKIVKKIAVEVAEKDVQDFVEYHSDKEVEIEKIRDEYPSVILAVQGGYLTFDDNQVPTFELSQPIQTESGGSDVSKIVFKTRLLASDQSRLSKGIDLKKDMFAYLNKVRAHYAGLTSTAYLDKFSKFDFNVIDQIVSVF